MKNLRAGRKLVRGNIVGKHKVWDLQSTKAPNGMKIVLFADFMSSSHGLNQAQYMLKQLCNEGHQITLFECANVSVPLLMYEDTQACLCQTYEEPLKVLERKVAEADAFLLVTDRPGFQIPSSLATVKHRFTGNNFTWRPYGVQCVLLGGSVHSRKVAMRLRVLLEGSDYPYMSGVLPRRCSWTQMYAVDPSLETPGPCVL
ncbi:uncharacterized protein LOC113665561 isoform X1 [Pocillopora damicornis]|uniref:uncharacterized protein LOC113665561 isoform X1 n=1 Tax=Pocillopora damicornis TaxID=46731 RepID=UPI000F5586FB|nr:uncharacterized protein LOC113665561 isoform X1 [Pocillopora damicornis]